MERSKSPRRPRHHRRPCRLRRSQRRQGHRRCMQGELAEEAAVQRYYYALPIESLRGAQGLASPRALQEQLRNLAPGTAGRPLQVLIVVHGAPRAGDGRGQPHRPRNRSARRRRVRRSDRPVAAIDRVSRNAAIAWASGARGTGRADHKPESRSTKSETNHKHQFPNHQNGSGHLFLHATWAIEAPFRALRIRIWDLFRISCFGFRISSLRKMVERC